MENDTSRYNRVSDWVIILTFCAALVAPLVGSRWDLDPTSKLNENRKMAEAPRRPADFSGLAAFTQGFEKYWNDAFGFRRLLIRANALARYRLGVSPTPQIIIGKQQWLYYTGEWSLDTYQGLRLFSEDELKKWRDALQARSDWMARQGGHYLLVIAPNKQSTYPEYMPERFSRSKITPLGQLAQYLRQHSTVEFLDMRAALDAAKPSGDVFWRTDTHWNDAGTFLCYSEIIRRLQQWYPSLRARARTDFNVTSAGVWSGDLAAMLGLTGTVTEPRIEWVPRFSLRSRRLDTAGKPPKNSIRFTAWERTSTRPRAVFFKDSYLVAPENRNLVARNDDFMIKRSSLQFAALMAEQFSHSVFSWQHDFDSEIVTRVHADVVVQELAERWLVSGPRGEPPAQ
jgi:alginate O-acetyltransferase complex protein AlgJ